MLARLQWVLCILAAAAYAQTPAAIPPAPAQPVVSVTPVDTQARLRWLLLENLDAGSVADDIAVGGVETFFGTPKEYGPHWEGFGERIGLVAGTYAVKSAMEVGLGSIWGEDPRYFRTTGLSVKSRMAYVIKMTFMARNRNGRTIPAYSRYIAFSASNFIANEWEPASEATPTDAVVRAGLSFLSRMGENAWQEFIVRRH